MLLSVPKEYGQYRLKITVLGDWPQLQKEGLEYFIKINKDNHYVYRILMAGAVYWF